jgi:hypothetical protein
VRADSDSYIWAGCRCGSWYLWRGGLAGCQRVGLCHRTGSCVRSSCPLLSNGFRLCRTVPFSHTTTFGSRALVLCSQRKHVRNIFPLFLHPNTHALCLGFSISFTRTLFVSVYYGGSRSTAVGVRTSALRYRRSGVVPLTMTPRLQCLRIHVSIVLELVLDSRTCHWYWFV